MAMKNPSPLAKVLAISAALILLSGAAAAIRTIALAE